MDSSGRGLTSAGRILGIISVVLAALSAVFWVAVFGLGLLGLH
jgi:hypothetical protein